MTTCLCQTYLENECFVESWIEVCEGVGRRRRTPTLAPLVGKKAYSGREMKNLEKPQKMSLVVIGLYGIF